MNEGTLTERKQGRRIGPVGTLARVVIGAGLVVAAPLTGASWLDAAIGLVGIPAAIAIVLRSRSRSAPPLRMYGPEGHLINFGIGIVLFIAFPQIAMLFYGPSMLLAAARGEAGCELFVIANWFNRRRDEIACPVFTPIDVLESHKDMTGPPAP